MFVYPKYFPALCVTETESDPKNIRVNGVQVYPVGMSIIQAMALVWKPKKFKIEASFKAAVEQCPGGSCVYKSATINGISDDNSEHANLEKMSDLICLASYYPEYAFTGYSDAYVLCDGTPIPLGEVFPFLQINININPLSGDSFPIYLYDGSYYLCMYYGIGNGGVQNLEDGFFTQSAGDFTIALGQLPIIQFKMYANPANQQGSCDPAIASALFTMADQRQPS